MSKKKEQSRISKAFWRFVISGVGIALILIALINLSLYFFGEYTSAYVATRRVGGADDKYTVSQRYEWSLDYTFKDRKGIVYSGHTTRRGSDIGVKSDSMVYYFPFAPFVNSLKSEVEPNFGQPLFVAIGIFLLYVMNKNAGAEDR